MAKLSAHGHELGRIELTTSILAYMSDGHILRHDGTNWHLYKRVKAGFDPAQVFEKAKKRADEILAQRPALAEYHRQLKEVAGRQNIVRLHTLVELLSDDIDGLWSEIHDVLDRNTSVSVEEVRDLVRAYHAAIAGRRHHAAKNADTKFVIHAPSESSEGDLVFWSNESGWGDLENATRFSQAETQAHDLPLASGQDARWITEAEARDLCAAENPDGPRHS